MKPCMAKLASGPGITAPDYGLLKEQLAALIQDEPCWLPNLANTSALLYEALPDLNWCGFYLASGETLILGPFQGKTACIRIPLGKGVCGTSALEDRTVVVPDVHQFPGHIACDSASNSEIVVPLHTKDGRLLGVLDIDSPCFDRFSPEDQDFLENIAALLSPSLSSFLPTFYC